jgi:hypothetical protein
LEENQKPLRLIIAKTFDENSLAAKIKANRKKLNLSVNDYKNEIITDTILLLPD